MNAVNPPRSNGQGSRRWAGATNRNDSLILRQAHSVSAGNGTDSTAAPAVSPAVRPDPGARVAGTASAAATGAQDGSR